MLLAVALIAMTLAVLASIALPLAKSARQAPEPQAFSRAVYRDQLKEVERDQARGLISETEAKSARLEIERRLLAAADAPQQAAARQAGSPVLAIVLVLLVAGGAGLLYLALGAPAVPDMPYAARQEERALANASGHSDAERAAAQLAEKLKSEPNNGEAWLLLARTEAALQHWPQAADAYHHALVLMPERPDIAAGYGEMLVFGAGGIVTPAAHDAFAEALKADPQNIAGRYYMALADAQAGNAQPAIDAWLKLAGEATDGSEMRAEIARHINETASAAGIAAPPLPPPAAAPPESAAAAIAQMPPEERAAKIREMVAGLAQRLKAQPDDLAGWERLGRSYLVLGEDEKAAEAFDKAQKLKPDDASIPMQEAAARLRGYRPDQEMPPRVLALLHRVETIDPNEPQALWYLGFAAAHAHRFDEATSYWERLLTQLPAEGPEHKMVSQALDAIKAK